MVIQVSDETTGTVSEMKIRATTWAAYAACASAFLFAMPNFLPCC